MAKAFKGSDSKKHIQQKLLRRSYCVYGKNGRYSAASYSATHPVTNYGKKLEISISNDN